MKLLLKLSIVMTLAYMSTLFAGLVDCSDADVKWQYLSQEFFRFTSTTKCIAKESTANAFDIYSELLTALSLNGDIISRSEYPVHNGMSGLKLDYKDRFYDSGFGKISVRYEAYLLFNDSKVSYTATSTSFVADQYATSTKFVKIYVEYLKNDEITVITLNKTADIVIPDHAPTRYFLYKTKTGLRTESCHFIAMYRDFLRDL